MGSVLIIDADEGFANDLVSALNARGLDVQVTPDGKAGLDLARINIPDAIVLCVELPRMSGYSICAKLKKDSTLKTVPLIITSAEATQETFEHHKKLKTRAEEYMKKPFAPEELVNVLSSYVKMNGVSHAAAHEELVSMDDEAEPQTLNDEEVFAADESDGMASIDQEIQNLKAQNLPPQHLSDEAGMQENFDEEDVMTTVGGVITQQEFEAAGAEIEKQALEIERLKAELNAQKEARAKAERERDLAVANEKAAAAQLAKMTSSQPPTAASTGREILELKKQLNAKDREVYELKDQLHNKDKELLSLRDREMEFESRIVEAQEAQANAEHQATQMEAKLAAVEAKLHEFERSSSAKIDDLNRQLARMNAQAAELDASVQQLQQELSEAEQENNQLTGKIQELQSKNSHLNNELNASRTEAATLREQLNEAQLMINDLKDVDASLRVSLDAANTEVKSLRASLEETEDRLSRAYQKIREDEDVKAKAKKALEIASALLVEAGFTAESEAEDLDKISATD